mmetsp:Transcript_34939/g.92262  ORF Transcript_34939/g.92262 Transcript_34939/m.92262 type:complete len:1160 (-) Transcript_34939:55-3534(-)
MVQVDHLPNLDDLPTDVDELQKILQQEEMRLREIKNEESKRRRERFLARKRRQAVAAVPSPSRRSSTGSLAAAVANGAVEDATTATKLATSPNKGDEGQRHRSEFEEAEAQRASLESQLHSVFAQARERLAQALAATDPCLGELREALSLIVDLAEREADAFGKDEAVVKLRADAHAAIAKLEAQAAQAVAAAKAKKATELEAARRAAAEAEEAARTKALEEARESELAHQREAEAEQRAAIAGAASAGPSPKKRVGFRSDAVEVEVLSEAGDSHDSDEDRRIEGEIRELEALLRARDEALEAEVATAAQEAAVAAAAETTQMPSLGFSLASEDSTANSVGTSEANAGEGGWATGATLEVAGSIEEAVSAAPSAELPAAVSNGKGSTKGAGKGLAKTGKAAGKGPPKAAGKGGKGPPKAAGKAPSGGKGLAPVGGKGPGVGAGASDGSAAVQKGEAKAPPPPSKLVSLHWKTSKELEDINQADDRFLSRLEIAAPISSSGKGSRCSPSGSTRSTPSAAEVGIEASIGTITGDEGGIGESPAEAPEVRFPARPQTVFDPLAAIPEPPREVIEHYFAKNDPKASGKFLQSGAQAATKVEDWRASQLNETVTRMLELLIHKHLMENKGETVPQAIISIRRAVLKCDFKVVRLEGLCHIRAALKQHAEQGSKVIELVRQRGEAALEEVEHPELHQLIYQLSKIPQIHERLKCMLLHVSFKESLASSQDSLNTLRQILNMLNSKRATIQRVFQTAHRLGQSLNRGSSSAQAAPDGFRLCTLEKLSQTKSTKFPKLSILHFVLALVSRRDASELFNTEDLQLLQKAKNIKTDKVYQDCVELAHGIYCVQAICETGVYNCTETGHTVRMERRRKSIPATTIGSLTPSSSPQDLHEPALDTDDRFHEVLKAFVDENLSDAEDLAEGAFQVILTYKELALYFDDLHSVYPPPKSEKDTKKDLCEIFHHFACEIRKHRDEVESEHLRELIVASTSEDEAMARSARPSVAAVSQGPSSPQPSEVGSPTRVRARHPLPSFGRESGPSIGPWAVTPLGSPSPGYCPLASPGISPGKSRGGRGSVSFEDEPTPCTGGGRRFDLLATPKSCAPTSPFLERPSLRSGLASVDRFADRELDFLQRIGTPGIEGNRDVGPSILASPPPALPVMRGQL